MERDDNLVERTSFFKVLEQTMSAAEAEIEICKCRSGELEECVQRLWLAIDRFADTVKEINGGIGIDAEG